MFWRGQTFQIAKGEYHEDCPLWGLVRLEKISEENRMVGNPWQGPVKERATKVRILDVVLWLQPLHIDLAGNPKNTVGVIKHA